MSSCERGGASVWGGATPQRGQEHPEERRLSANGTAPTAARAEPGGQEAKVRGYTLMTPLSMGHVQEDVTLLKHSDRNVLCRT